MVATPFLLRIDGIVDDIEVTAFTGQEALNALYAFDVHLTLPLGEPLLRRTIEAPASLMMLAGEESLRTVHGIVARHETLGTDGRGRAVHVVRVVPRLFSLTKRRSSRIFQDASARDIVSRVLDLSSIRHRWQLVHELPKRAYCVQYDETDYDFVTRMCASEGIFFHFEHPPEPIGGEAIDNTGEFRAASPAGAGSREVLILSDSTQAYRPLSGGHELRYRPTVGEGSALAHDEDHISEFRFSETLETRRVLFRRFDLEKPPIPRRDAASVDDAPSIEESGAQERGRMRDFVDRGLTVYEHQHTREQALLDPVSARTALEAETAGAAMARGQTANRRLLPGRRFRLVDHSLPDLDGDYAVVSISHEGHSPFMAHGGQSVYLSRFEAVPASIPFRAARQRRALRQGLETATVVGPAGEEIFTDALGRVKVQFHWDLSGGFDDSSSCWLRVSQPWAQSGYGAQFIPRIGSEVLVGYIDGDTDRPVVVGSLYNGVNKPAYTVPRDRAFTGIKTSSTPQGGGSNELRFDDRAGMELVVLRSIRTMQISASQDAMLSAEGDFTLSTGAKKSERVGSDVETSIGGAELRTVGSDRETVVGGSDKLIVGGAQHTEIAANEIRKVEGTTLHIHHGSRSTVVGNGASPPAHEQISVDGRYHVGSFHEMTLSSERQIVLSCGESKIRLLPDQIIVEAPVVQVQASKRIGLVQGEPAAATLSLEGSAAIGGGTVAAVAGGKDGQLARLFLDTEAHLDGVLVKLNCGPLGSAGGKVIGTSEETGIVRFEVSKKDLPPEVSTVTLLISTPSGEIVERECAVGGSVEMVGKIGEVFTLVETRIGGRVVTAQTESTDDTKEGV